MTASSHLRRELKDSLGYLLFLYILIDFFYSFSHFFFFFFFSFFLTETCGTLLELVVSLYSETPSSFDFHCLRVKIEDKEAKIRFYFILFLFLFYFHFYSFIFIFIYFLSFPLTEPPFPNGIPSYKTYGGNKWLGYHLGHLFALL